MPACQVGHSHGPASAAGDDRDYLMGTPAPVMRPLGFLISLTGRQLGRDGIAASQPLLRPFGLETVVVAPPAFYNANQ